VDKIIRFLLLGLIVISVSATGVEQSNPVDKKTFALTSKEDFSYKGAFIMNRKARYGVSDNKYAAAVFELSADKSSFYFAGRKKDGAIAEFKLPELVLSNNIRDLNVTNEVKQAYSSVVNYGLKKKRVCLEKTGTVNRVPTGNPQCIDRITGLMLYNDMLVANVTKYYDGNADNTHTTMLIADPANLDTSEIYGFFSLHGAAHASGWISEIPPEWQQALGGDYVTGWASSFPIAKRNSIGPSAFIVNLKDINPAASTDNLIPTTALLDFSLANPLHPDKYNNNQTKRRDNKNQDTVPVIVGDNNLWTVVSWAVYGFILPNTRTYAVFGSSGGHNSGLGYKINQDNGHRCPGPCTVEHDDYYNYYWFFNVDDLVAVKNGDKLAHEVRPYDYGIFPTPFQNESDIPKYIPIRPIRGGNYDRESNTLYLVLGGSLQEKQIVIAYSLKTH